MSRVTRQRLSHAELLDLAYRVFSRREQTVDECAGRFPLETLCETLASQTSGLPSLLSTLPEGAFGRQPDDPEGNDVWSAGQIISHLAQTTVLAIPYWEALLARRIDSPGDAALAAIDAKLPSYDESIAAAGDIAKWTGELTAALSGAPSLSGVASHFALGVVSGAGALLGTCIHTADHIQQLDELGAIWRKW